MIYCPCPYFTIFGEVGGIDGVPLYSTYDIAVREYTVRIHPYQTTQLFDPSFFRSQRQIVDEDGYASFVSGQSSIYLRLPHNGGSGLNVYEAAFFASSSIGSYLRYVYDGSVGFNYEDPTLRPDRYPICLLLHDPIFMPLDDKKSLGYVFFVVMESGGSADLYGIRFSPYIYRYSFKHKFLVDLDHPYDYRLDHVGASIYNLGLGLPSGVDPYSYITGVNPPSFANGFSRFLLDHSFITLGSVDYLVSRNFHAL